MNEDVSGGSVVAEQEMLAFVFTFDQIFGAVLQGQNESGNVELIQRGLRTGSGPVLNSVGENDDFVRACGHKGCVIARTGAPVSPVSREIAGSLDDFVVEAEALAVGHGDGHVAAAADAHREGFAVFVLTESAVFVDFDFHVLDGVRPSGTEIAGVSGVHGAVGADHGNGLSVDRDHQILLAEAHLPDFEFGVEGEFHFRLIGAVVGLNGQLQRVVIVLQHGEVQFAEGSVGNASFPEALGVVRFGRDRDGLAVLVDQRELVFHRVGGIGVIGGADEIEETFADDFAVGDVGDPGYRSHLHHVDFKRQRRRFAVDGQRDRVFAVLIKRRINASGNRSRVAGDLRDLARTVERQSPRSGFADVGGNGNIGRSGLCQLRSDAEVADRTGQREVEQCAPAFVAGGVKGFRLKRVRAVAEHHRVENVVEFGSLGDCGGDGAVEKQIDPGDADVVGCGNRNVQSAALRIHRASGGDDVTAVSGDQLHSRSLKVGNRIVQRVSSGNRIGVARLVGGGHGDEQRSVGVESRTDRGQKILDRDIA